MTIYLIAWAVLFVVFSILEAVTTQLVSIWFALGSLGAFIAAVFDAPAAAQIMIFIILSVILLLLTRPLAKKLMNKTIVPTNADSLIGQIGQVIESIDNFKSQGRVAIDGLDWSARSDDGGKIEKGTNVVVKKITGVRLIVHVAAPEDYS
ncbi:nodulation efficiency protein D [[Clostridium] methylpentosum DSM 5476]|jgi:membrane protein implicated in regulation of membrane protease activity|uniref:Nodulation efficiency protein D n=1 Tax=[Clostridium] methylpentosum DSM 5476 TaxID=537013 RepID=C0E8R7_9FIRM|nr:nodulation efficiency protein D [[Clostridium] methylpentosum DSM 5476]MDY3989638.1 NfeD family protein [Massilioclostridium sp.]MEE1490816.1 NfeD family protein [Massilioclostridium sp.]